MIKIILTFILCLSFAGTSFAQNNMEAMKLLTIDALMQYGQKLYDRGNFNEASAVFNHVLTYDGHQPIALQYLKDMGHSPLPRPVPVLQPQVSRLPVPEVNKLVISKSLEQMVDTVDVSDTESLKEAIEAKKQIIKKLRIQIMQMRSNIASPNQ